jgi:hypothetical protein
MKGEGGITVSSGDSPKVLLEQVYFYQESCNMIHIHSYHSNYFLETFLNNQNCQLIQVNSGQIIIYQEGIKKSCKGQSFGKVFIQNFRKF